MKKALLGVLMLGGLAAVNAPVSGQTTYSGPYYANPSWNQQIPAAQRFTVLSGDWNSEAVLDRETGLVWERTPISTRTGALSHWSSALSLCAQDDRAGNRWGWRTPSVQELASLLDSGGNLPAGSPFLGVAVSPNFYWSATTFGDMAGFAYFVSFGSGSPVNANDKTVFSLSWCVRGGSGPDIQ